MGASFRRWRWVGALALVWPMVAATAEQAVASTRLSFHAICPLAVEHPSITWVDTASAWSTLLSTATQQPAPFAARDLDVRTQRLVVVAGAQRPSAQVSMRLAKGASPITHDTAAQRVTIRVLERDEPVPSGMMVPAVVGQPCLLVWLRFKQPVREVVALGAQGQTIAKHNPR
jgi:hypothetical protein